MEGQDTGTRDKCVYEESKVSLPEPNVILLYFA